MKHLEKTLRVVKGEIPRKVEQVRTILSALAIGVMAFGLAACTGGEEQPAIDFSVEDSPSISANSAPDISTDASQVCKFDKEYKVAILTQEGRLGAVKIPEVRGDFEVLTATTIDGFFQQFNSGWLMKYLKLMDVAITKSTNELKCKTAESPYKLNITLILLTFSDPMPRDLSRPYGHVEIDKDNQIIQGVLILNPYQVLADQLWLHEGIEVQPSSIEFSPQEFSYWKTKFHDSVSNNKIDVSEIPPHVYWLLSISARQTSRVWAHAEWTKIMAHSVDAYVDITKLIIDGDIGKINKLGNPIIQKLDDPELYEKYKYNNRRTERKK